MKKPAKILAIVLTAIVVLLVAIGVFGGSLVKKAVQVAGTSALKVPVAVSGADLSVLGGTVGLRGVQIDNPPGYQHKKLLTLGSARISVSVRSLLSDTVHIRQIILDGVDLTLEQKGLGSNLQDIIHNLPKSEQPQGKESTGKKLQIDLLEIRNIKVEAKLLPIPGKADTVPLKLSTIRMTDLGKNGTLDAAGLTAKVLLAIAGGIAEQGTGLLPKDLVGGMSTALNKTAETGRGILKGAAGLGKGVTNLFAPKRKK